MDTDWCTSLDKSLTVIEIVKIRREMEESGDQEERKIESREEGELVDLSCTR